MNREAALFLRNRFSEFPCSGLPGQKLVPVKEKSASPNFSTNKCCESWHWFVIEHLSSRSPSAPRLVLLPGVPYLTNIGESKAQIDPY